MDGVVLFKIDDLLNPLDLDQVVNQFLCVEVEQKFLVLVGFDGGVGQPFDAFAKFAADIAAEEPVFLQRVIVALMSTLIFSETFFTRLLFSSKTRAFVGTSMSI